VKRFEVRGSRFQSRGTKLLGALLVLGAAACTGLFVDKGNNYPCDFREAEDVRDRVCAPDEVCGVDNVCRPFHYEGPQFEGRARLPRLDAGTRLHPGQLDSDVKAVALNGFAFEPRPKDKTALVTIENGGAEKVFLVDRSQLGVRITDVTAAVALPRKPIAAAYPEDNRLVATAQNQAALPVPTTTNNISLPTGNKQQAGPGDIRELRTHNGRVLALRRVANPLAAYGVGEVGPVAQFADAPDAVLQEDGGLRAGGLRSFDVALVPPSSVYSSSLLASIRPVPVVVGLTEEGFAYVHEPLLDAGTWRSLHPSSSEGLEAVTRAGRAARLKTDLGGRLLAYVNGLDATNPSPLHRVLSTWTLVRTGLFEVQVARAWPDCTPCPNATVVGLSPGSPGKLAVEVLCTFGTFGKSQVVALRVVGSSASAPEQACDTEAIDTAFEPNKLETAPFADLGIPGVDAGIPFDLVQDQALTAGVVLGGPRGRVYVGPTYSVALPLFLDRLPTSTGLYPLPDGGSALAALTDRYASVRLTDEGFEVVDMLFNAHAALPGVVVSTLVGEAPGWVVLSTGDVVLTRYSEGAIEAVFGPRLLSASDTPVTGPFLGEGVTESDGGVRSLVLTANDSLYFARALGAQELSGGPNALPPLRPDVTPEPNSPIRSLALERSALGTDGLNRVRAYVATARNLYLVQYGGTPARWTSTPLVLTGESPVEVWMDHPRGGLGRVGYPSGEVYTLPGAFLLAKSLTASGVFEGLDAGAQVQVEDYENLAGWPVAYTRAGLFIASYAELPDGGLDNKLPDGRLGKPMGWTRVRLAAGNDPEPWLGKSGRLQAVKGPRVGGSTYTEEWKLVVFTGDEVYEAAAATRSNAP
jgi:hypothetical protein